MFILLFDHLTDSIECFGAAAGAGAPEPEPEQHHLHPQPCLPWMPQGAVGRPKLTKIFQSLSGGNVLQRFNLIETYWTRVSNCECMSVMISWIKICEITVIHCLNAAHPVDPL